MKWFAVLSVLALTGFAALPAKADSANPSVQNYANQAFPEQYPPQLVPYNSPLAAGQMTLQDVLRTHPPKPPSSVQPLLPPAPLGPAAPPLLSPSTQTSSASVMLMQGMKTALQADDTGGPVQLKPPQMQPAAALNAPMAPSEVPVVMSAPPQPGVTYQPGEGPKNFATAVSSGPAAAEAAALPAEITSQSAGTFAPPQPARTYVPPSAAASAATAPIVPAALPVPAAPQPIATASPAPVVPPPVPLAATTATAAAATPGVSYAPPAPEVPPAPLPPAAVSAATSAATASAKGACEPHVSSWTKTCAEAGYPENFTGKITGETRTVCPDNSLQDVWIANSCAPPEEPEAEQAAPLPEPVPAATATTTAAAPLPAPAAAPATPTTAAAASAPAAYTPPPAAIPVPASAIRARTDASCGPVNGLATNAKPNTDLCASGDASDVSGDGPWAWSCKGINGGMTVSCAAPVAAAAPAPTPTAATTTEQPSVSPQGPVVEEGACGSADGNGTDHAPAANLCSKGAPSRVNGSGPWTWACSGLNGGKAAACMAPRRTDGICGAAANTGADQMPISDLCAAGYASAVTGTGPWNWTCSGLNGGAATTCAAQVKTDAVCGSASLAGHHEAPRDNLCSVGQASSVHGSGPWTWACNGGNGGATVSCAAPVSMNGVCGSANGVAAAQAPSEELCAHGNATRVTGSGPWSWNCSGTDGGDTQSCTAPVATAQTESAAPAATAAASAVISRSAAATTGGKPPAAASKQAGLCGSASELMALEMPDKDLCSTGTASAVSGEGPWTWTCTDDAGHASSCSTLSPEGSLSEMTAKSAPSEEAAPASAPPPAAPAVPAAPAAEEAAACGYASGQGAAQAPGGDGLCSVGKASAVRGSGPWRWTCVKGKSKAACEAPKQVDAACGVANGSIEKSVPTKGLCAAGTPTDVQGSGPWLWSCVGEGGGSSISCSAASQAQTRVDGSCGAAANTPVTSKPAANLCDSGIPSVVYGEGPWTWTCSGLNGGIALSCATQKNVPPPPPPPAPPVNGLCGAANGAAMVVKPMDDLCNAGTPTSVSGNGPWNWDCLGQNSGMTVSCTAPLQPPAPITGQCGDANGVPTLTMPKSGLCSAGISSSVSGRGPWTWSCSGTNGGGAVGCVAPLAQEGGTGMLPSLTGPDTGVAPAPQAAPVAPAMPAPMGGTGLVTPQLPAGTLPPLDTGTMPPVPSNSFGAPPQPSVVPSAPSTNEQGLEAPAQEPALPEGTKPLPPPAISGAIKPSPAFNLDTSHDVDQLVPANTVALAPNISTFAFTRGSENINEDQEKDLLQLVGVLKAHPPVRITLTAYAASTSTISPRDARRISLARALAIRDYLTSEGISSGRIDVRALGANVPSGDMDRVDVKVN